MAFIRCQYTNDYLLTKKATDWVPAVAQLDFYTFFRELLRQILFLYFPDKGCDPARPSTIDAALPSFPHFLDFVVSFVLQSGNCSFSASAKPLSGGLSIALIDDPPFVAVLPPFLLSIHTLLQLTDFHQSHKPLSLSPTHPYCWHLLPFWTSPHIWYTAVQVCQPKSQPQ